MSLQEQLIWIKYASKLAMSHDKIYEIGNDEETWPIRKAIWLTENALVTFYTYAVGKAALVEVRTDGVRKWLQTVADGVPSNNLLSLPPCRVRAA